MSCHIDSRMRAVLSDCGLYRYRLARQLDDEGANIFAFFGINPSTADAEREDATTRKWNGFVRRWGGSYYVVGNAFAFRSTDVRGLATASDPIGPDNDKHLREIINDADILVPCWGNATKVPKSLRHRLAQMRIMIRDSGKPVRIFGLTNDGDPLHPLMLGYDTKLIPWTL